ncbi:MAG: beta-lactamase [Parcubacteria group bacterium Gr01-1014_8]|nr:MAG: beta-lactamase [Parcubacteria group bacterium Gr01-1014_8]
MRSLEERLAERSIQAIEECVCPGGIVGIVKTNGERKFYPFGRQTYSEASSFVAEDTIYDVASITKSIPTASLALTLLDKGALRLDDAVMKYVPEYNGGSAESVAITHLLTYTIDGVALSSLVSKTADEILQFVYSQKPTSKPGSVFRYSNTPALLLGLIVERVFGVGLGQAASDNFFRPLKMKRTGFLPGRQLQSEIAPTEMSGGGELRGIVHDESARVFAREERVVGHAGLFSCAPDLVIFLEMLLKGGKLDGRRYFSNKTIRNMATNQIQELGDSTGLGWELNQPHFMGKHSSVHTFGKTGFTGCSVVCDIERDVAFVLLTNRTYPKRPADNSAINVFRSDIADAVFEGI